MSIAVRELTLADHLMVDELREAMAEDSGSIEADRLAPGASGARAFLADSASFMFGAYVDHDVGGGAWGVKVRHPNGAVTVEVRELFVLEAVRRRGIGTLLVESAMAFARRSGAETFLVRTQDEAEGALCTDLGSVSELGAERWSL